MNKKERALKIFDKDLEVRGCGYYSVCLRDHRCSCDMRSQNFNFELWESMREEIERKYEKFWKD